MKIIPIITEKTTKDAKVGKYTFKVSSALNKYQIRRLINETFDVHVTEVKTINRKKETQTTIRRTRKTIKGYKKAIVSLKDKEKLDIFDTKK